MIKPTVGRKVWYRPSAEDLRGPKPMTAIAGEHAQPLDATIIAVWGDTCVNLLVIDMHGQMFPVLSCRLLQGDEQPSTDAEGKVIGRYAEWMPYQQGQARRDAATEAAKD
jgi:hypothetical protein